MLSRNFMRCLELRLLGQFKRADRSGAQFALVYGESEQATESVTLKPLRSEGEQVTLPDNKVAAFLAESFAAANGE